MTAVLPAGTLLHERYAVTSLIGSGGMGAVYLTDDNRLVGRRCAVKETRPVPDLLPEARQALREQFHQEANVLAQLDHPNLPKVSDYFSHGDRDYLVMDYVAGPDLAQMVAEARSHGRFLEEDRVLEWTRQLCDALAYMHAQSRPIVHRDIKPANIKLTPDGWVKLVDFGLVKPLDTSDPRTITNLHGVGSLPYTPIEQYVEEMGHTDPRSDLYAMGATLYHLLTGEAPPSAQDRFLNPDAMPAPRQINADITPRTEKAILWAMALHPSDRPGSAERWYRSLTQAGDEELDRHALGTRKLTAGEAEAGGWSVSWRSDRVLFVLAGLLLLAALLTTFGLPAG